MTLFHNGDSVRFRIAAGGIADARGVKAFCLGARVEWHVFVAADETNIHQNYKDMVLKAKDIDTKVTGRSTGHPVRAIRNGLTREYMRLEEEGATLEELEQLSLGSLRKAVVDGDTSMGSFMAGQISGLVCKQTSVKQLLRKCLYEDSLCFSRSRMPEDRNGKRILER